MCGHDDHIHDTYSQYDHATGVMRFIQKCVKCVWSRVVHEEEYRPGPEFDGAVIHLDDTALLSHSQAWCRRWDRDHAPLGILTHVHRDQSVRRAA